MYNIGDSKEIPVIREEANFDRACDAAYKFALMQFMVNEDGHAEWVSGWERSCCSIEVEFISYKRSGNEHVYWFRISTSKVEDTEEDE